MSKYKVILDRQFAIGLYSYLRGMGDEGYYTRGLEKAIDECDRLIKNNKETSSE